MVTQTSVDVECSVDSGIQCDTQDTETQVGVEQRDMETSATDLPIPELEEALKAASELKSGREELDSMLSQFYIPVQFSDTDDSIDGLMVYLNGLSSGEARTIALFPGDDGFVTATHNTPARRASTLVDEDEEDAGFNSFEVEDGCVIEELQGKLAHAYKVYSC